MERKIIAFDIGSKNLAFCQAIVNNGSISILRWEVHDISGKNIEETIVNCCGLLRDKFYPISQTHVLIERQYHKNITAYALSHSIAAYFIALKQRVTYVNANVKQGIKVTGQKRKKAAVEVVSETLQGTT